MLTKNKKHRLLLGISSILVFSLVGCSNGKEYKLHAVGSASSALGEVTVSEDNLGNTTLHIETEKLGTDNSAAPPKYYIAWTKHKGETVRLGQMNIDHRRGALIAITDLARFSVMITSEHSPDAAAPSKAILLETETIIVE